MLSRTAENLYWMARNIERAENMARILDITNRMSLLPNAVLEPGQQWDAPLLITGLYEDYFSRHTVRDAETVMHYLALDPDNPTSIFSCLRAARDNGRAVRTSLTVEMWESLNATWLELKSWMPERLAGSGAGDFFDRVKTRSHLFRGVTHGTMLRDESFQFIRLGTFVERADNTARILDVKYHILLPSIGDVGGAADYYQWGALLRSVSAFQAYRKSFRDVITPRQVAELLILREDMPRSLHACLNEADDILGIIGGPREPRRLAGELHASLHYGRIEDVLQRGLHEYLTEFLQRVARLGDEVYRGYFAPSV